jgi:geranylgeranyl diphosphate synthase type II
VDVDAYMAERIPRIDAAIDARLGGAAGAGAAVPERLRGAMRHLLFPGGKRLRPLFALAAAEAVGGPADAALPIAVAVELVHTYSLIHDDLPCMDDDDERRGRPTVHVAYDEATAVLAGDALLAEAFAVLAEADGRSATPESIRATLACVHGLALAAGARGLVGGQCDDLAVADPVEAGALDVERLASIHARKTAALFQAAIAGGALLAGADEADRAALEAFACDVGIAFQIADDLLDADSGEAASILRVHGIDDARRGAEALLDRALERIRGLCERAEPLRELARFAVRRDR